MYRKDIFDKNGLIVWKAGDTEGFYQTLKKLKEIYPNSVPMSSKMANNFWWYQQAGWGSMVEQHRECPMTKNQKHGNIQELL